MDATVDKMAAAFGGGQKAVQAEPSEDLAKQLARAKEYESTQNGRLKAQSEEIERLRKENEELRRKRKEDDIASSISEEERAAVPDEVINASTKMMRSVEERLQRRIDEMRADQTHEREEAQNRAKNAVVSQVTEYCPGFLDDVSVGGSKNAAWEEYKKYNGDSVNAAFARGDFASLKYHIDSFYQNFLHVQVPSGGGAKTAEPAPRSVGGTSDAQIVGKTYTMDEFSALFDQKEQARSRGDFAEVKRISDEINRAQAEGRVKQQ